MADIALSARKLGEGAGVRRVVEDRVVAEAACAARLVGNEAFSDSAKCLDEGAGLRQGEDADESRPALVPGDGLALVQEQANALLVVEAGAAEARGPDSGGAVSAATSSPSRRPDVSSGVRRLYSTALRTAFASNVSPVSSTSRLWPMSESERTRNVVPVRRVENSWSLPWLCVATRSFLTLTIVPCDYVGMGAAQPVVSSSRRVL